MTEALVSDAVGPVSCPLCHTQAPALTDRTLAAGEIWRCPLCHIAWSAARLATVAAHAEYSAQSARPANPR